MDPLFWIETIQAIALVAIAILLLVREPVPGPPGPAGPPGPRGEPGPPSEAPTSDSALVHTILAPAPGAPPSGGIWETLKRVHGEWVHVGWVRESSPAWEHAFNTPGMALRQSAAHPIEEGKQ